MVAERGRREYHAEVRSLFQKLRDPVPQICPIPRGCSTLHSQEMLTEENSYQISECV